MRNQRRTTVVAGIAAVAALLTACGSDAEKSVPGPNYATVTGAGRDLQFPASVDRRDYPNACRLIPADTMQTLIGAPATSGRTTAGCAWSGGEASLPTVVVQFVEIGDDAASVYTERVPDGSSARGVGDVGRRARVSRLNENMTTRVDVLQRNAFFRVEVRIPVTAQQDLDNAEQIGIRVAQLVAEQIS